MQGFLLTKLFCMAAILCVAKLLTSASPANIVKRSDDTHPLEAIVAQQARTIQELQAKMSAMEMKINQQVVGEQANMSAMEIKISTLSQHVAFTAYFSYNPDSLHVGTNTPFKFDKVVVNIGQAYDPNTGIFTAPAGGLYSFFFNIEHDNHHGSIYVALEAAGKAICFASVNGPDYSHYDEGTCGATTHLVKGQTVQVRRDDGDFYIHRNRFTSFSGVLVSADV
ncbi:hypothetical protein V1264_003200 [Littorina saxatilis]|uniref:C1q domain-containing protein n=1 Tax=Littorina saxatilis TaxID=31220 RepID=A0AAN9B4F5_9CAEN